jgi:DNA-binding transcriptional regulator YiaG
MSALLKSKFTPKSKSDKPEEKELSPGEKQAIRRKDRMSYQTLATIASMK